MDKMQKILQAMSKHEREATLLLMEQLIVDYKQVPGIKALQAMKGWFRVRIGRYRIIFTVESSSKKVIIQRITRRNEKTYKGLER